MSLNANHVFWPRVSGTEALFVNVSVTESSPLVNEYASLKLTSLTLGQPYKTKHSEISGLFSAEQELH